MKYRQDDGNILSDPTMYRTLDESLAHSAAIKRTILYILVTSKHGIFFPSKSKLELTAYYDIDWFGCSSTRHSMTRLCVYLGALIF